MTQNGVALTVKSFATDLSGPYFGHSYGYLVAPTSGTFTITWPSAQYFDYVVFTVQDAAQTNPIDANYQTGIVSATSFSTATTTTMGNDLLLSMPDYYNTASFSSFGSGETSYITEYNDTNFGAKILGSWKPAGSHAGSESMTINISASRGIDESILAVRPAGAAGYTSPLYRAKVDNGSFNVYSFSTTANTWTVYDKKGTKYTYGSERYGPHVRHEHRHVDQDL